MSPHLSNTSYIICYREASEERQMALHYVLQKLRKDFPSLEILVIEQDSESKLVVEKELNIQHFFIKNSGLFNRSWAFNCAVKKTNKDIIVFGDADIFLEKEGLIKCIDATAEFDAITPNKSEISNIAISQYSNDGYNILNQRKLHSFAGGMLIITKDAFKKIGGWDERFEGWGGEDDAMTHIIYNRLKSKTFNLPNYHIDHAHEFVTGNNQPNYEYNKSLVAETLTRSGPALDRYIEQLKSADLGDIRKYDPIHINETAVQHKFILAITTYNRLGYLKTCVESFIETRSSSISWQLIIADDNSTDGTKEYLQTLEEKHDALIIHNNQTGIHYQVNSIIKVLSGMSYDLCFKCDDDVQFLKCGWDILYWDTINRSGYDHLIFYDKQWLPYANLSHPVRYGNLVSNCRPDNIQGALYTLTPDVIRSVGYFDGQQFGTSGLGHIDFSFRCCRAGFNVLSSPFDVDESNQYIQLQAVNNYNPASSSLAKSKSTTNKSNAHKKQLLKLGRIFVPFNENYYRKSSQQGIILSKKRRTKKSHPAKYKKADATFYPDRGVSGFIGFLLKRIYNLSIDMKLYIFPASINFIGKKLNKLSIHLLNIHK